MLKLSLALDSPLLIHTWQHQVCSEPRRRRDRGGLQVLLGWVQGWLWRRVWCGWLERLWREDVGSQQHGEGRVEGERPSHNCSFRVWTQPLNLVGPAQSSLPLPLPSNSWMKIEMLFSLHSWVSQSPFYLYCWEDPSWPCSVGSLIALWIALFNCHLFKLWDP